MSICLVPRTAPAPAGASHHFALAWNDEFRPDSGPAEATAVGPQSAPEADGRFSRCDMA